MNTIVLVLLALSLSVWAAKPSVDRQQLEELLKAQREFLNAAQDAGLSSNEVQEAIEKEYARRKQQERNRNRSKSKSTSKSKEGRRPKVKYTDRVCKQIQCNFEEETMCNWVSLGRKPTGVISLRPQVQGPTPRPRLSSGDLQSLFGNQGVPGVRLGDFAKEGRSLPRAKSTPRRPRPEPKNQPLYYRPPRGDSALASFFPQATQGIQRQRQRQRQRRRRQKRQVDLSNPAWYSYRWNLGDNAPGVKDEGEGGYFAAVILERGEKAVMETALFNFTGTTKVSFLAYEAGFNTELRFCCETPDYCPYRSKGSLNNKDFKWVKAVVECPENTEKLMIICDNFGSTTASCGIDNMRLARYECRQHYVPPELNPNNLQHQLPQNQNTGSSTNPRTSSRPTSNRVSSQYRPNRRRPSSSFKYERYTGPPTTPDPLVSFLRHSNTGRRNNQLYSLLQNERAAVSAAPPNSATARPRPQNRRTKANPAPRRRNPSRAQQPEPTDENDGTEDLIELVKVLIGNEEVGSDGTGGALSIPLH